MVHEEILNNAERDRLCNLLDEKRDELIMRFPGSWMHRFVMAEISVNRNWLRITPDKAASPRLRFLVKRQN